MWILTDGSLSSWAQAQLRVGMDVPALTTKDMLPKRSNHSHKGDYGKAAIVAGGEAYSGAALLALSACLRSGVGYTALFTPKALLKYFYLQQPEALLFPSNDGGMYAFNEKAMEQVCGYTAVAYGMGLGCSEEVAKGAKYLLRRYQGTLLLDADGLNALAQYCKDELSMLFSEKKCNVILTPHVKEFSRLSGESVERILQQGYEAPKMLARTWDVTILLKNAVSVIADGERTTINATGNSGQAKAGSGDVLSGLIVGLCAQGCTAFEGGCLGAYLTGKTAELVAEQKSEYAMLPSDVAKALPDAFLSLIQA